MLNFKEPIEFKHIFNLGSIQKSQDQTSKFLGIIEGKAATSQLDRHGEIITDSVLEEGAKSLLANSTVFFNHEWGDKPIGVVQETKFVKESDSSYIHVKVGISKTAQDIMTLIEEGALKSFSIGGILLDYDFKEMDGNYVGIIKEMDILEVSVVGIPANPNATITDTVSKALKGIKDEFITKELANKKENEVKQKALAKLQEEKEMNEELEKMQKQFVEQMAAMQKQFAEQNAALQKQLKMQMELPPITEKQAPNLNENSEDNYIVFSSKEEELNHDKREFVKALKGIWDGTVKEIILEA